MALKHIDIWRAIDQLAEKNGFSPSGLAIKAGLSSTSFNPSKRQFKGRKRWPSTESIAAILQATGATLDEFVALATGAGNRSAIPLMPLAQAARKNAFDEAGHATERGWDSMSFPGFNDLYSFALEATGKNLQPVYREGDRIVVSPADKPRRGDRVVVRLKDGEIIVRQLVRESAGKIELLPLKPDEEAESLSPDEIEWMYRIVWVSQ